MSNYNYINKVYLKYYSQQNDLKKLFKDLPDSNPNSMETDNGEQLSQDTFNGMKVNSNDQSNIDDDLDANENLYKILNAPPSKYLA